MQKISDFSILPIAYSTQATHYLYVRAHSSKQKPGAVDPLPGDRTLFVVNIPPDATERELKTLFGKFGTVERVVFAGHERVEEILQEEAKDDDEEMQDNDTGMESDGDDDDEDDLTTVKGKGRKERKRKIDQAPKVVPLPIANLRHFRKTGGIGHL
ncbi:Ribosomal RNA-processing protein 7 [Serendipita sp. 401]|nr:Ribosomal RNA-processing protein 7 [Serendipita sp. 401]